MTSFAATAPIVQIVLHQEDFAKRTVQLAWSAQDTVHSLKSKLAEEIGAGTEMLERMNVIFCGKALQNGVNVADLMLGPQTSLTVTLKIPQQQLQCANKISSGSNLQQQESDDNDNDTDAANSSSDDCDCTWIKIDNARENNNTGGQEEAGMDNFAAEIDAEKQQEQQLAQFSSFYAFCKACKQLERAKLRAYCRVCHSTAIMFRGREPECWRDVLDTNCLRVNCQECDQETAVRFRFKCLGCNEVAIPLMHLKRVPQQHLPSSAVVGQTIDQQPLGCVICNEEPPPILQRCVVNLGCAHPVCVPCFAAYADQLLFGGQACLQYNPQIGYTIGCPVYGCKAQVSDVHTFYLLGIDAYNRYQRLAAELYFLAQQVSARLHCPAPGCGAAFLIEDDTSGEEEENNTMFYCPECSRKFCRLCRSVDECKCADEPQFGGEEEEEANAQLIRTISKPCPKCAVPTERAGGCAHIHCTQCQNEWCFICQSDWTENCQWDHWFD